MCTYDTKDEDKTDNDYKITIFFNQFSSHSWSWNETQTQTEAETVQHHSLTKMSLQHPPFPMTVRTCSLY